MMSRPLLQLALDHTSLEAAQRDVALLQENVDIVEAGTILCLTEGLSAVKALRAQCPNKIIVADWKVADAGETLAQQAFGAGANWMTIICAAPLATVEKGHGIAQSCGGEILTKARIKKRHTILLAVKEFGVVAGSAHQRRCRGRGTHGATQAICVHVARDPQVANGGT